MRRAYVTLAVALDAAGVEHRLPLFLFRIWNMISWASEDERRSPDEQAQDSARWSRHVGARRRNRMATAADQRADLDLQISLLAEHEITKLAAVVSDLAAKLGVENLSDRELQEVKQNIKPEAVLDRIEKKRTH